ncbi:MAG: PTS sugar transporter subunit IIC [Elusimicrobiaceae bacterium]
MSELLIFALVAGLLELDTAYAGQFLVSRPVIAGLILGFVANNVEAGVLLGLWFELLYTGYVPVGASVPPSGLIAVAMAVSAADIFGVPIPVAFLVGLFGGKLFSFCEIALRNMRSGWNSKIIDELDGHPAAVDKWIAKSVTLQFVAGAGFVYIVSAVVCPLVWYSANIMPAAVTRAIETGFYAVPWIGFVILAASLKPQKVKNGQNAAN